MDSAPVGPVSDSFLLKNYADATVYMVRQNVTLKPHLKMIDDISRKHKFSNLCIVFNGLKKKGFMYGNYGGYGSYGSNGNGYYLGEEKAAGTRLIRKRIMKTFGL